MLKWILCALCALCFFLAHSEKGMFPTPVQAADFNTRQMIKAARKKRSFRDVKHAIYGEDDRVEPVSDKYSSIVKGQGVIGTGRGACNALCVHDDIVVTAAHCLLEKGKRTRSSPYAAFRLGTAEGGKQVYSSIRGGFRKAKQNISFGARYFLWDVSKGWKYAGNLGRDWAIVYIDKPICKGVSVELKKKKISRSAGRKKLPLIYFPHEAKSPNYSRQYEISGCKAFSSAPWQPRRDSRHERKMYGPDVWFNDCDS